MKYFGISHLITDSWENIDVYINAAMGSGKSYFVISKMFEKAVKDQVRLSILCSRKTLEEQYKNELFQYVWRETLKGRMDLWMYMQSGNLEIKTYHKLAQELKIGNTTGLNFTENAGMVVFDEVHCLYTDSTFATDLYIIVRELHRFTEANVSIFMTATGQDIFPVLQRRLNRQHNYCYSIKPDYSYLRVHSFNNDDTIISAMKNDKSSSKWVVYVSSKKEGENLKKMLKGMDVAFLCSENRDSERNVQLLEKIKNENCFDQKVLITTTVIDAGISLKMPELKNIVTYHYEYDIFIQTIGRKRVVDGEVVNLFVKDRSARFMLNRAKECKYTLDLYTEIRDVARVHGIKRARDKVMEGLLTNQAEFYRKFIYYDGTEYDLSWLAVNKLFSDREFYDVMYQQLSEDGNAFMKRVMQWLDKTGELPDCIDELGFFSDYARKSLVNQIESILLEAGGEAMTYDEDSAMRKKITALLFQFFPNRFPRGDRAYKWDRINDILCECGLMIKVDVCVRENRRKRYRIELSKMK